MITLSLGLVCKTITTDNKGTYFVKNVKNCDNVIYERPLKSFSKQIFWKNPCFKFDACPVWVLDLCPLDYKETRLKTLFQPQRRREKLHRFDRTLTWHWPDPDRHRPAMAVREGPWQTLMDSYRPWHDPDMTMTWSWQTLIHPNMTLTWCCQNPDWLWVDKWWNWWKRTTSTRRRQHYQS